MIAGQPGMLCRAKMQCPASISPGKACRATRQGNPAGCPCTGTAVMQPGMPGDQVFSRATRPQEPRCYLLMRLEEEKST